ncbi:hypothetical protein [Streptomyces bacillaris]|uniref:hypothetical protein n=1 Tax=Streptomyces bacillaris TaxID=68179 RepID=UPI00345F9B85
MTPCPSCRTNSRRAGQYLCPACWSALPQAAREALGRRDGNAMARLRSLHTQLVQHVPLADIRVMPDA